MENEHDGVERVSVESNESATRASFLSNLPRVPLIFLGLGFYRAWIEIAGSTPFPESSPLPVSGGIVFQIAAVVVWLLGALFAEYLAPLSKGKAVFIFSGGVLVLTTIANYYLTFNPDAGAYLSLPVAIASGVAIALVILLWSEFYGCFNPLKVALYYSCSIIAGALLVYLSKGLVAEYLIVFKVLLPVFSVLFAYLSFKKIPEAERPRPMVSRFSFPWKPVLLMAIFSFAYGLKQSSVAGPLESHSSAGVVVAAAIVLIAAISQGEKFNFGLLYRFGFPLMVASFLLVPDFGVPLDGISWFCAAFSYTAFSILIMILMSSMVYRYGVNALWLFGIERAVRQLFTLGGSKVNSFVASVQPVFLDGALLVNIVTILLIIATTMIFLSEKELASSWGVEILADRAKKPDGSNAYNDEPTQSYLLSERCSVLSKQYMLSTREAEVLLLLAQKKSIASIERELLIANGTAKAHVRHIYQKFDIHSREELFEKLESKQEE